MPLAASREREAPRHQHSSHLCSPPGHGGHWSPWASQPCCSHTGMEDGRSRQKEGPQTKGIPSVHIATCPISCPAAGHLLCRVPACEPPQLSPHPAPRRLPWMTASPLGWASAPQTPPHSMPGPHCAGSSLHLSPCQEEKRYKGPFFHIMFQQTPSHSTFSPRSHPSTHVPRDAVHRCSCPVPGVPDHCVG